MKKTGLLIGLAFMLTTFAGSLSAQPTYFGEVCFSAGDDVDDLTTLKLALSDMGDNHFIVNGVELIDGAPVQDSELYNGNGEIIGNQFVMMIHTMFNDPEESYGGKFYVKLSLDTLSGTLYGTNATYDKDTQQRGIEYFEGVIAVIACPE